MTEFKIARKYISLKNRLYIDISISNKLRISTRYIYKKNNYYLSLLETITTSYFIEHILIDCNKLEKGFDSLDVITDFVEQDDTFLILKYGREYLDNNIISSLNEISKLDNNIDTFKNFLEYE